MAVLKGRGEAIRRALREKREKMELEKAWHPCLWCGAPIGRDRVKHALMRNQQPKYCGEECRRNEPGLALVNSIFGAALGASRDDEALWQAEFDSRIATATAPCKPLPQRKGKAK